MDKSILKIWMMKVRKRKKWKQLELLRKRSREGLRQLRNMGRGRGG